MGCGSFPGEGPSGKIQDHEGIPPFQQRLSFNFTDLEDQETVGQHQIKKGAVLKLVKRYWSV